jgi:hypothetical protein
VPGDGVVPELNDPQADQPRADRPRLPESDRVHAELQERMERLPRGHPSSPYNDDGTRKPPPLDLSDYELPIPGDPDYHPDTRALEDEPPSDGSTDSADDDYRQDTRASEADRLSDGSAEKADDPDHQVNENATDKQATANIEADRSSAGDGTPRINTDGSWEWKGNFLSPDRSHIAARSLGRCREVEGRDQSGSYGQRGLTPAMRRIEAELDHCELAPDTEKFALKSTDRFKEKFAKLTQRYPGENPEILVTRIHDGIRYTFLSDNGDYVSGVWEATDKLQEQGFELVFRKNNWGDAEYKGVNTRWRDPTSGLLFEVQLHTYKSWDAKQQTHDAYEKINDIRIPVGEVERQRQHQREVSSQIPMPSSWETIPDYRKEDK